MRAVDAGVAFGLARVLAAKLDEGHTLSVRVRMLLADLLRVQDMQVRGRCWKGGLEGLMIPYRSHGECHLGGGRERQGDQVTHLIARGAGHAVGGDYLTLTRYRSSPGQVEPGCRLQSQATHGRLDRW